MTYRQINWGTSANGSEYFFLKPNGTTGKDFKSETKRLADKVNYTPTASSIFIQNSSIDKAGKILSSSTQLDVIQKGNLFLTILEGSIYRLELYGCDTNRLTDFFTTNSEDGSTLFEWISQDFRLCISIEPEPEKSSWHIATKDSIGDINLWGYLPTDLGRDNDKIEKLLSWLLFFVARYSE